MHISKYVIIRRNILGSKTPFPASQGLPWDYPNKQLKNLNDIAASFIKSELKRFYITYLGVQLLVYT